MNLCEKHRMFVNSEVSFDNPVDQSFWEGLKGLFKLISEHGGSDRDMMATILELLIIDAGRLMERRLPAQEVIEKHAEGKITDAEYDAQISAAIHNPHKEPLLSFLSSMHPLIKPTVTAKDIFFKYRRDNPEDK